MTKTSFFGAVSYAGLILMVCLQNASASERLLDIDANGRIEPLTDGLLIIRHLFGFNGTALTQGALSADASRTDASVIEAYLKSHESTLDIDLDGQTTALTDGLLIIRSQFGFTGNALTNGAVESNGQRNLATDITLYIDSLEQPGSANAYNGSDAGNGSENGTGSGSGTGGDSGNGSGNASGNGSGSGSGADSSDIGLLPEIESDLNAHIIALTDHIDSRQKPVFYGLTPMVSDGILMLALDSQKIDRSNVKALLDADSTLDISLKIMMLLDRIPPEGQGGDLAIIFRLIDGNNADRTAGEREIYTRTTLSWSSNGSEIAIDVPTQDQPLTGWDGEGNIVEAEVFDAKPNIFTARLTPEYPGYPLAIEIKALELFDERLLNSFLFRDIIPTYFDSVKDYFLVIGLEKTGSNQDPLLSFQGQSFNGIHANLTIDEVIQPEETGFNLTTTDETSDDLQIGYLAKLINLGADADQAHGLFTALEARQLIFEQPPTKSLNAAVLNTELFKSTVSTRSPALELRLNQIPTSEEILDVAITFTDGEDAIRTQSERQLSIEFSSRFGVSNGQGLITTEANATILTLDDDSDCAATGGCRIDNLTTTSEMFQVISSASIGSSSAQPRLQLSLLPLLGLSGNTTLPLADFFTQGHYHLQVNITGASGPFTYEGLDVDGLNGVISVK